jgi:hypothetical protein
MSVIQKLVNKKREIKRAFFLSEIGLGDHIDTIGAVRYLSQFYNEIHVPCRDRNIETLTQFYSDNPKVVLLSIEKNEWFKRVWIELTLLTETYTPPDYVIVYRSAKFSRKQNVPKFDYEIPKCYYKDLDLDLSIEHSYFHIPENLQSKQLYELVKDIPYIFVHQKSSDNFTPLVTWDINEKFTIEPNMNLYSEGHKWYELANHFVNKPFYHYIDTVIHASELHVVNSSFRCLSAHLPLEATVKKCYHRETGEHIPQWTFNRHNPTSP